MRSSLTTRIRSLLHTHLFLMLWLLVCALVLAKAVLFFRAQPDFTLFWDYLGHIQKAQLSSWLPWQSGSSATGQGWDTTYYGGYATLLYPGLSHIILKGFFALFHSRELGTACFVIVCLLSFIHALGKLTGRYIHNVGFRLVAFSISMALFTISPTDALATLKGYLFAGPIATMVAVPLLLYFLASRHWLPKGILLGLLFLTHTMTASLAVLFMGFEVLAMVFSRELRTMQYFKSILYTGLLGFAIGLPWILPFLDSRFHHEAFNLAGKTFFWGVLSFIIVLITLILALRQRIRIGRLLPYAVVVTALSLLPFAVAKFIELFIRGIHFYRYYAYAMVLVPTAVLSVEQWWQKVGFVPNKIVVSSIVGIVVLTILGSTLSPLTYRFETYWDRIPASVTGRFIDEADSNTLDVFARTAEHTIPEHTHLLGSVGLFFETAETGLVYGATKQALNDKSFSVPVYQLYIVELAKKAGDTDHLLDLFGINYKTYTTDSDQNGPDEYTFAKIAITKGTFKFIRYYHLKKISDTPLIETLPQPVPVDTSLDLWNWWGTDDKKLIARQEVAIPETLDLHQPAVSDLQVHPTQITFTVNADQPAPVYLKFSYSPYWQAVADTDAGSTTQPVWVTPGNMVIYAHGPITLNWRQPGYERLYGPVSLTTFLISLLIWLKTLFKKNR